jgi:uncharacterized protein YndB with AHSA1/START domain
VRAAVAARGPRENLTGFYTMYKRRRNNKAAKYESARVYAEREFTITRIVNAPRSLVFKAWTEPEHIEHGFAPRGYTIRLYEWDPTPGGLIWLVMRSAEGDEYPVAGAFRQVVEPERLVLTELCLDREAKLLFKSPYTVTFAESAGKTKLTVEVRAFALDDTGVWMIAAMDKAWTQTLDCLDEFLATLVRN